MKIKLLLVCCGFSQKNVFLTLTPKHMGLPLSMGTDLTDLNGTTFNLDHFDYYVSGVHIIHDGGQDLDLSQQVFLVEPQNYTIYLGYQPVTTIESIQFSVGVPPTLNTSSGSDAQDISTYPAGHPLSFQEPSMYWGWSAGYMHMILGGLVDEDNNGTVDNTFELHNLGDANYRSVDLLVIPTQTSTDQLDIYLDCNLDQWMKDIPISTVGILHGTTGFNMEILKNVETEAVFTLPNQAVLPQANQMLKLYVANAKEGAVLHWSMNPNGCDVVVFDMTGRRVENMSLQTHEGQINLNHLPVGSYTAMVSVSGAASFPLRFMR